MTQNITLGEDTLPKKYHEGFNIVSTNSLS